MSILGVILSRTTQGKTSYYVSANMEELSKKLKELRKKKGWTQEDMAREITVSLSTVQRWEKKGGEPTRLARRELQRLFRREGINLNS